MTRKKLTENRIFKTLLALVFWLGVWQLAAGAVDQELLIPAPLVVAEHLAIIVAGPDFWAVIGTSFARILSGFILGCLAGTLLAALCSISAVCGAIVRPFIKVVSSVPVTSFIILVMLWLKYTYVPVFIAALLVVPVLFGNVSTGIEETSRELLEVANIYRFGRLKTLKTLYIPSVLPYFWSGAFTGLGLAWKAGIAAEVLALPKRAIGSGMYFSKLYLETADLFAWTIIVTVFSFALSGILGIFMDRQKKKDRKGGAAR
jgi:NitT/TauT family transport system permease protein